MIRPQIIDYVSNDLRDDIWSIDQKNMPQVNQKLSKKMEKWQKDNLYEHFKLIDQWSFALPHYCPIIVSQIQNLADVPNMR